MTKATLTFDLSDPDDRLEHIRAVNADNLAFALWEIVFNLKKTMERELEAAQELSDYDILDKTFEHIHVILDDHGIIIDDWVT